MRSVHTNKTSDEFNFRPKAKTV